MGPRETTRWVPHIKQYDGLYFVSWKCEKCGYVRNEGWEHTYNGKEQKLKNDVCQGCDRDCTMCGIRFEKEYDFGY